MMVGMKLDTGVDICEVRNLVDKFAAEQPREGQTGEPIGFLWVEDIPQHLRNEFLAALASLSGPPGHQSTARVLSSSQIWPSRVGNS